MQVIRRRASAIAWRASKCVVYFVILYIVVSMRVLCSLPTPYQRIKKQLRTNTVKIGTILTTGYTVFDTREAAVSAALGAATALAYVGTLSKYVDTIDRENQPFQSHVLLPGLLFGFETACIRAGVYEFDYSATAVCFLSYQFEAYTLNLLQLVS